MAYTATNYPEYTASAAVPGKKFLLYVEMKSGSGETATDQWELMGGLRDTGLEISADSISATDKTNNGWAESIPGMRSWTSSPSCVVKTDNDVLGFVENWVFDDDLQSSRPALHVAFVNAVTKDYYDSWCTVSSFSIEASMDDVMQVSMQLNGCGPLEKKTNFAVGTVA